jgi:hypothetical protein
LVDLLFYRIVDHSPKVVTTLLRISDYTNIQLYNNKLTIPKSVGNANINDKIQMIKIIILARLIVQVYRALSGYNIAK